MATRILDLDVERLPDELHIPEPYTGALILLRCRRRPVGQVRLSAQAGRIDGQRLREAVLDVAAERIALRVAAAWAGVTDDLPAPALAATVAICTRDRPEDLNRCLTAVRQLHADGQEILVIDSASSTDATARVCEGHAVRCVREERPGLDRARNRALREATTPIVAFSDDDAAPDRDWLRALAAPFSDPRVLGVTGLTLPLELETEAQEWFERTNSFGRGFDPYRFDGVRYNALLVAPIGAGANMALRRDVLTLVGPFDEALDAGTPTRSGGDHNMFTRILAAGYAMAYEPNALSWHRHRREWEELRQTLYGYGSGVYAHLTQQALCREINAPRIALGWFRVQLRELLRTLLRRPGHRPMDLITAELAGCAAGPFAYWRSRRLVRRA